MKHNYRILKLRSGEDVITKIVGGDKKNLTIDKPMAMKVASFVSPDGRDRKNVLCMKDWLEYTDKDQIAIPRDWIAVFLQPDNDVIRLYELEKKRIASGPEEREIAFKEKIEEELAQEEKSSIMEKLPIDPNSVIASFAIPPKVFLSILANGLLQQGLESEGPTSDLFDALFGDIAEEDFNGSHERLDDDEDDDKGHGNRWRDWSDNPNDYI